MTRDRVSLSILLASSKRAWPDFCGGLCRLVHGEDLEMASAFIVDPDTQGLYACYGRANLPRIKRQKRMTGESERQGAPSPPNMYIHTLTCNAPFFVKIRCLRG